MNSNKKIKKETFFQKQQRISKESKSNKKKEEEKITPWWLKKSKDITLNIKKNSKTLNKNNNQYLKEEKVTFIDNRETDKKVFMESSKSGDKFNVVRKTESITFKNRLSGSDEINQEFDEIISSQESNNSDSNDNQKIFDDESQIQDIDDDSSIISIILFNAHKDKDKFKPSLFNEKNNIKIDDLDLTIKTFNSLRRNDIRFLHQLSQLSKNELLKLKNLGYKSCEELITAIINFHQKFDDENNINDQFKIKIPKDNRIEKLNTNSNVLHLLKRNGIINISDLSRFTEFEIKNINGFGPIYWDNLKENLKIYEKNYSTKINFKDGINNDGILCNAKDNDYSDEFWNFIQEKFKNIKTQTNDSDIENIDKFLELFFQEAYEKNNNLKTLEMIYLISDEACEKFNDSSIKKSTLEYSLYKYLIFKKFLNSNTSLNALSWIRNFRNVIEQNNSIIIYLQRISGKTLAEIGRERNVSRERIRQIELKISKYIGTSASELTNICGNLKEKIIFKEEYSAFLEIIKKFGRIPHKLDKFSEKNNLEYIDNLLKLNLKERIDIYEKFKFEIPASEYDFHYEYITYLNGMAGNGYWLKLQNLKEYLFRHAHKLGEPDLMPKQTSLPRAVGGVVTRHGGQSKVASLIGLKYQGQLVNPDGGRVYWTDERLEELIDDVNKFLIQDLSIMPERSEFVDFFKHTTITKYHAKKVYSAFAAFTKQEVLSWEDVAKRFKRKTLY